MCFHRSLSLDFFFSVKISRILLQIFENLFRFTCGVAEFVFSLFLHWIIYTMLPIFSLHISAKLFTRMELCNFPRCKHSFVHFWCQTLGILWMITLQSFFFLPATCFLYILIHNICRWPSRGGRERERARVYRGTWRANE